MGFPGMPHGPNFVTDEKQISFVFYFPKSVSETGEIVGFLPPLLESKKISFGLNCWRDLRPKLQLFYAVRIDWLLSQVHFTKRTAS